MMNLRCSYCQTLYTVGRDEMLAALQKMDEEHLSHYDTFCPRCRRANPVPRERMEWAFPNWRQALEEKKIGQPAGASSGQMAGSSSPAPTSSGMQPRPASGNETPRPMGTMSSQPSKPAPAMSSSSMAAKPAAKPAAKKAAKKATKKAVKKATKKTARKVVKKAKKSAKPAAKRGAKRSAAKKAKKGKAKSRK